MEPAIQEQIIELHIGLPVKNNRPDLAERMAHQFNRIGFVKPQARCSQPVTVEAQSDQEEESANQQG